MGDVKAKYESVQLSELDWEDETFAIKAFAPCDSLADSLHRFGMLQPAWVHVKDDGAKIVVDGFRRLEWLRQEGHQRAECLLFPADHDPQRLMLERLEAKLFGPVLNPAQKAQIVLKLSQLHLEEATFRSCLSRLGIAARAEVIGNWCRLAVADEKLLLCAALEEVCERAALELAGWESAPCSLAVGMLQELRCSASIQMEILERVKEIALREEISRQQVLNAPDLSEVMIDPERNHREKTRVLRERLYARRYPRIRAREERFARDLSACVLPNGCRMAPPPSFEGESWQLQLTFKNPEELQRLLADVRDLASSDRLRTTIKGSD